MFVTKTLFVIILINIWINSIIAVSQNWRNGIIEEELIFSTAPFLECHAATIAQTANSLVSAWFGGTKEGNSDVGIWISRRTNNSWSQPIEVADGIINTTIRYPTWNPVLYQIPNGDLLLFYKIGPNPSSWKGFLKRSTDEGKTWSPRHALPDHYLGCIKNKPILHDKDLICPSSTEDHGWKVHLEVTQNFGQTWSTIVPVNSSNLEAIQPTILVHSNNTLQMLCRSKSRAILESWSSDGGHNWSPLTKTKLPNNNSGLDAVTLKDGQQLIVYNHVLPPEGHDKGQRSPLNVALSNDGKLWSAAVILEDEPKGEYSYPSVIQSSDGLVHIVYTWKRLKIKYVVIDPEKFRSIKIENGVWPQLNDN